MSRYRRLWAYLVWACVLLACGPAVAGIANAAAAAGAPVAPAAPAPVADVSELDRVMGALAQRQHGHVSFTEKKFIALLDKPVESSGELLYDAPDRLAKRTLKPKPEDLVLEGGVVSVQRGRRHYVLDLKQYPQVLPFIESIRATLAGDRAALERVFKLEFGGHFEKWTLELAPLDAKLAKTVSSIHIEGEKDFIHTIEVREADGDRSLMTISPDVSQ